MNDTPQHSNADTAAWVSVPNPDDLFGMPIFEGPADEAANVLAAGVYAAVTGTDEDCQLVVTTDHAHIRSITSESH